MKQLLVWLILIVPLSCSGKAMGAFSVNGTKVSAAVFDRLYRQANEQAAISAKDFRQKLVDSLVMSQYAKKHYPNLSEATNVGYDPALTQKLQVNRLLLKWFAFDDKQRIKAAKKYMQFVLTEVVLTKAIGKPSILGYELTTAQRKQASDIVVANISIPGTAPQQLNLAQLYDEQSVQGRMAFHQGELKSIQKYAYDHFFVLWHRAKSVERSDFDQADLLAIERIIEAKFLEPALMFELGALTSEHGNNDGLKPFKARVSQAQIDDFYQAHKQDFEHVSSAKARLLTFTNQKDAKKAFDAIKAGQSWDKLANKAGQSGYFPGSNKGWLQVEKHKSWLSTLAFALPQGQVNPPVRSPKGRWHLVKVEQKRNDFYKKDSDTVVFQATNAIARVEARKAFTQLKQQLLDEALITYHENQ